MQPEPDDIEGWAEVLSARIAALPVADPRLMVAIAGPPASGKSTLAEALVERLETHGLTARHVPMDGFHLDDSLLEARGLLSRKGAPETFDAAGFVNAMQRLAREEEVILPRFDRSREISLAGCIAVDSQVRVAVVEGNYLAFDEPPWTSLAGLWDLSVFLSVAEETLRSRLLERWRDFGFNETEAARRAEENDLPNALRVLERRVATSLTLNDDAPGR